MENTLEPSCLCWSWFNLGSSASAARTKYLRKTKESRLILFTVSKVSTHGQLAPLFLDCDEEHIMVEGLVRAQLLTHGGQEAQTEKKGAGDKI